MTSYVRVLLTIGITLPFAFAGCGGTGAQTSSSASNSAAPTPQTTSRPRPPAPTVKAEAQHDDHGHDDSARRITPVELQRALTDNKALVVDVRSKDAYDISHIKGSISIPDNEISSRAGELPRDKMIVTYCS